MKRALVAMMLGTLLVAPCAAEQVMTRSGAIDGKSSADGSVTMWLGIPYAAPPVGELRWKATRPHAPWTEVFKADTFGSPCAQMGTIYGPPPAGKVWGLTNVEAFGQPVGEEDCLTKSSREKHSDSSETPQE